MQFPRYASAAARLNTCRYHESAIQPAGVRAEYSSMSGLNADAWGEPGSLQGLKLAE
jgi:hypothetical protein